MNSEPKIIYENEHLAVIDKPAGWLTHGDGRTDAPTITDWFALRYPAAKNVGETMTLDSGVIINRAGIVHRLDRDTSGVMVVAKNELTYLSLKSAFADRRIKKSYRLIVQGIIKNDHGAIDTPIGRSAHDPRQRTISKTGRAAATDYQVLKRFDHHTYVEAYPKTGRTHQLRVHFKSIQHPIIGDALYGDDESTLLIKRMALHSYCLELPTFDWLAPSLFIAPLPLDFFTALAALD